jgi:hypothetical protein
MDKILTKYNEHYVAISKSALDNDICEYVVYTISDDSCHLCNYQQILW